jgi:hypothetical protein
MTAKNTETYTFTHDGKKFTIPAFSALPMGAMRKARKAKDEADQAFTILEAVMPEDSPELNAIDAMQPSEFNEWLNGWTQNAPVGESASSEK